MPSSVPSSVPSVTPGPITPAVPGTERDATLRDYGGSLTSVEDVTRDVLPAHSAAAPPAPRARGVARLLQWCQQMLQEQGRRRRLHVILGRMSERELSDIGVTRGEIECIAARRKIDRLREGTHSFWMR